MENSKINFNARATGPDLKLIVRFDGQEIVRLDNLSTEKVEISHEFDDSRETEHHLEIELSGKLPEHTHLDDQGNIIQDRYIEISDFSLDSIEIEYLFSEISQYHHDFNGTGAATVDKFFGTMGCNGTVSFKFSSPVYLWLLESM